MKSWIIWIYKQTIQFYLSRKVETWIFHTKNTNIFVNIDVHMQNFRMCLIHVAYLHINMRRNYGVYSSSHGEPSKSKKHDKLLPTIGSDRWHQNLIWKTYYFAQFVYLRFKIACINVWTISFCFGSWQRFNRCNC